MSEEEQTKLLIQASLLDQRQQSIQMHSEDEMLRLALEESKLYEQNEKLKDDEEMLKAIKESHLNE